MCKNLHVGKSQLSLVLGRVFSHTKNWSAGTLLYRYGYVLIGGLAFAIWIQLVDFRPPPRVRDADGVDRVVRGALAEANRRAPSQRDAVQLRAELRMFTGTQRSVLESSTAVDYAPRLLSSPAVTTLWGMRATIEQSVRLQEGDTEVDLTLEMTPRRIAQADSDDTGTALEYRIRVNSRRTPWWDLLGRHVQRQVHFESQGVLFGVSSAHEHRFVFEAHGNLFSLDIGRAEAAQLSDVALGTEVSEIAAAVGQQTKA